MSYYILNLNWIRSKDHSKCDHSFRPLLNESNISPTSGPNELKFRYVVALEQSFPMSIKSKRSGGNLQYLSSYRYFSSDYFYYNLKG
ncbi:hypothetical protein BCR32DRAFT_281934 [Anaeromyces robustus]|uniref:Uncharacterized protein n=1 Tax=Anaeromyces robustus TaxID=1754192 RepID=A0A1Y1WZ77_9FUNG|nr:hypothetical protein BCR32DRAFT_281934 [Anaeromyces robustus]|eukprot:ORX78803.1 hypothetical protein BCR32DRAFT_281934 [Anaeromyces robustus]